MSDTGTATDGPHVVGNEAATDFIESTKFVCLLRGFVFRRNHRYSLIHIGFPEVFLAWVMQARFLIREDEQQPSEVILDRRSVMSLAKSFVSLSFLAIVAVLANSQVASGQG